MESKYYVYSHIRLDKDCVFYIGIGKEDNGKFKRAFVKSKSKRTEFWHNIINKTEYKVIILYQNLSKKEACDKEIELIKKYGRRDLNKGTLVNQADGGEDAPNFSKETIKKISCKLKGNILSQETKDKIKESVTKTWNSPEYEKQREIHRERAIYYHKLGTISRAGKPSSKKGKPFAGDKENLSKALKKCWASQEKRDAESLLHGALPFNVYELESSVPGKGYGGKRIITKGKLLFTHHNISYCAELLKVERNHIRRCLRGKLGKVKNYVFEYENK